MMKLKPWLSCFLVHCFLWSYWEDILFTQWFLHVSISLKGFFCRLSPSLLSVYNTEYRVLILQLTNFVIYFKEEYRIHSLWKCSCKEFC